MGLQAMLARLFRTVLTTPARINAPDSRFVAERIRTVVLVTLLDFNVPTASLQAMPARGRDIAAIGAIRGGRHGPPSDAHFSTLLPIGALPQLAPAAFGSPYLAVSSMSSRCSSRVSNGHAWAGATEECMMCHVVHPGVFS